MEAGQTRRQNTLEDLLAAGREAYSLGDRTAAHELWRMAAVANPYDERVWAALMEVLTRDDDREVCLENIIAINPLNPDARRQLRAIKRSHEPDDEAELESSSKRQLRAQKRAERLQAEAADAAAADEPFMPPTKTQTVRSIVPEAPKETLSFEFDDEEEPPKPRRSLLRSLLRGFEIGLLAILISLLFSVIVYGGVLSMPLQ
jgi:hypothetical protein